MTNLNIIIAGAGLGGLAAACSLIKAGFSVRVYERSAKLGEVGAGIQLSANAMHVLAYLGLDEQVNRLSTQPEAYVFRLYNSGEELQRFALAEAHLKMHRAPYNQIHRADLHNLLSNRVLELAGKNIIHLDHEITSFHESDQQVMLNFKNRPPVHGDILIGADGVKSLVRNQICGEVPAKYTGDAVWRVTVPTNKLPKNFQAPVMAVWMGPGRHAVSYFIRNGKILNFVGCVETEKVSEESWTAKFPWENLKKDFEGWHSDIQVIIDLAQRDRCYRWSLFKRPVVDNWSTKRVSILGDAAHATLPYLAQGAAMALEDGVILSRALAQESKIEKALKVYSRNRIPRTRKVVNGSDANRELFHLRDTKEMKKRFKNGDQGSYRNNWLYSYNPLSVELV